MRLPIILFILASLLLNNGCAPSHQSNRPDASVSIVKAEDEGFSITVSGPSFSQMVADGNYDWKNPDVENFALRLGSDFPSETSRVYLVQLGFPATTERVVDHFVVHGFVPSRPEKLLAFGNEYPEEQRRFPIFALRPRHDPEDNMWKVFGLVGNKDERGLYLATPRAMIWPQNCRFLVERK